MRTRYFLIVCPVHCFFMSRQSRHRRTFSGHPAPPILPCTHALRCGLQSHIDVALPFLQVDRTTSHHVAITADGELLTWCCGCEMMEQADNTGYMAPPSPMLYQHHGIPVWQSGVHHSLNHSPAEWHCACTGCSASLSSLMSGDPGVDARHQGSARSFLRVLANKQAVADVACGQRHTIALLVTGEVRVVLGAKVLTPRGR